MSLTMSDIGDLKGIREMVEELAGSFRLPEEPENAGFERVGVALGLSNCIERAAPEEIESAMLHARSIVAPNAAPVWFIPATPSAPSAFVEPMVEETPVVVDAIEPGKPVAFDGGPTPGKTPEEVSDEHSSNS